MGFNLEAHYPMMIAIVMSFVLALLLGFPSIPLLKRLKAGQSIREDGPQSHLSKAGTPTMGGLFLIAAAVVTSLVVEPSNTDLYILIGATVGFGAIGFIDDFIKVVLKRNLGLRAYQKMLLQILIAAILAIYQLRVSAFGTSIYVPVLDINWDIGIFYVPFIIFFTVAVVNGVNLTDGLDGLASGVTLIISLFLGITAIGFAYEGIGIFAGAITGACLGFLIYNKKPAKVFMGDTGSLALGGAIAAMAILLNMTLIIPLVGGIVVAEVVSVIIQVLYFKKTKKRFFKMAPLHHHFEMSGWKEQKVAFVFWGITLLLCLVGGWLIW